ncbi:MAG: hybrid sensor histidine kinase/response regulator [Gammaproteobacteria bacterium]|nr:hybrid sensor histidine kinase/response regulator [Gammaproteobacteria bacterium]
MLQPWILVVASLIYIGVLFAIAHFGDNQVRRHRLIPHRPLIYSLSLAIYCTSWTYYGAVGSAATSGWGYFAIYLGPIIVVVFGFHFIKKLATICVEHNVTTIADFIASRYGKAQSLAVLVTLIAILGTLPYIALQLKAVALSYNVLASQSVINSSPEPLSGIWSDTGLIVAAVMALFSILFGTRYVNASEHHEGIILAVAFEAVVKLFALIMVCLFALYSVFDGPEELIRQAAETPAIAGLVSMPSLQTDILQTSFLSHMVLAMAAIFCLPRQFHVTFVEVGSVENMKSMRWMFPVYLAITSLVVVPITLVGSLMFEGQNVNPDMFVLTVPMAADNGMLSLLAFIGGFSAATGMVIVAVIALSTMVCNDIVMPVLFKIPVFRLRARRDVTRILLIVRRLAIVVILYLAYSYYRYINELEALASIGLVSFVAAIQFAPAIVGGVYWKNGSYRGASIGLLSGFLVWLYTLFLPTLIGTGWMPDDLVENGPWGIAFLKPYALFGFDQFEPITHGLLWSLTINLVCYVYFSLGRKPGLLERIQAANFTQTVSNEKTSDGLPWWSSVAVGELRLLAEKFIGEASTRKAFAEYAARTSDDLNATEKADAELIGFTERLLAGAIGASSARLIISSILKKKKDLPIEDVFSIVDEASQALHFSQELLTHTIEHIDQGISVVDENLNIVAWNSRYLELYKYPKGFIHVGRPIADVIRFNAEAGECGPGEVDEHVEKRLNFMRAGTRHTFIRYRKDGTVLEIQGKPMPGGGFVTSFTDITEHKKNEQKLREINENLEQIVEGRTRELSRVNGTLSSVNAELEQAIQSKVKFLAAVNHDVMQPLNAARLFTSALSQAEDDREQLTERIISSLRSAEEIIHTLLDVSKLDSGAITPKMSVFNVSDVIDTLCNEFTVIAAEKNIRLKRVCCDLRVESDPHLLRRVLQNFISNALRYTPPGGRVTLGCRRHLTNRAQPMLSIRVYDTGVGMHEEDLQTIFEEFKRLDNQIDEQGKGVGLGLAIAQRIAGILGHRITVRSRPGKGSMFSLTMPISQQAVSAKAPVRGMAGGVTVIAQETLDLHILCIDNDRDILDGMAALMGPWGCRVHCATSFDNAVSDISAQAYRPDIMLVDYHLDRNEKGLDVMDRLRERLAQTIPGVLITADVSEDVKELTLQRGYNYLSKPVNPGRLRNIINRLARGSGRVKQVG